ncbi:MAG: type II toxin-antitoxin system YafQ family toxin [Ruminococcus sp.]|nr:type II toxin-antitoxin system YafQ family toxin [Ruminococcus sp.]
MLKIRYHNSFKKDLKLAKKRGWDTSKLDKVIEKLANGIPLDVSNKDHELSGKYTGLRECHIESDWLLVYSIDNGELTLWLYYTGTHSDLFR